MMLEDRSENNLIGKIYDGRNIWWPEQRATRAMHVNSLNNNACSN